MCICVVVLLHSTVQCAAILRQCAEVQSAVSLVLIQSLAPELLCQIKCSARHCRAASARIAIVHFLAAHSALCSGNMTKPLLRQASC